MTEEVIPLRFDIEEVGKHVKSSKKRFTWELALKGRSHVVVLDFSFISGKVKVTVDRKILFQSELPNNTSFQYPFTLDGNALNVIQQGENFELRINNKVFSHMYNQMKTNTQFKKYQDEVRDIKVDTSKLQGRNKKITLNIGGLSGGMKKKNKGQNSYQEHNWNAFSADSMSFPSYFQGSQTSATSSGNQKPLKKVQNLLDESNQSINTTKTQSILDFESEIKHEAPVYNTSQNLMQFNTMQKMFATMNMGTGSNIQKPSVVVDNNQVNFFNDSPSSESSVPTPPSELKQIFKGVSQYNTMQNLFATNQLNNSLLGQNFNTKQSVNPNLNTNSNIPQVNADEFSTMQQMFATNNNLYNFNLNTNSNNNNSNSNVQQKPIASSDYNTMQLLFTTNNNQNQTPVVTKTDFNSNINIPQTSTSNSNINLNDFNTMQHMFSTTNPSMTGSFGNSNVQTANFNTNSIGNSNKKINSSQYNTMQNLFATTNSQSPVTNVNLNMNIDSNLKLVNNTDYNTMQNLFATNSQCSQFKTNTNGAKVNQAEFNTMQNMFATNNALFNLNVTSQNSSKVQVKSQQQKISITNEPLSPNTMYMNTYSGVSSGQNGLQNSTNMFTTGVGISGSGSMKKNKQHSALDIFELANNKPSTTNSSDLL